MAERTIIKNISKSTRTWVILKNGDDTYYITSNKDRSLYTLYKLLYNNRNEVRGYEKIASGVNPFDLEEKYVWEKKKEKKKKK